MKNLFNDLFVFDIANNHQGDVNHGKNIIETFGKIAQKQSINAGLKFQFRDIDTFIHKSHKKNSSNKHVPRFLSTKLTWEDYKFLLEQIRKFGLKAICTPFDEISVQKIKEFNFDIIKIASCSALDWPLIDAALEINKPIIVSTGGLKIDEIDKIVSHLEHSGAIYALMHCVSVYPTPDENCDLNNIKKFKDRYRGIHIGWSTHEDPDSLDQIKLATSLGAKMFERHIGIQTDEILLNAYSSSPEQVESWINAWKKTKTILGSYDRLATNELELKSIKELKRTVFLNRNISQGEAVTSHDVYFAFPYVEGSLESGDWHDDIISSEKIAKHEPLPFKYKKNDNSGFDILKRAIREVKGIINENNITLGSEFKTEYSHHYGREKFFEYGVVLIDIINREYCKKLLIQLPGQKHPSHYHKRKEETFIVLSGELICTVDGKEKTLTAGDTLLVLPGVWHSFRTETGCIFEEISTTHYKNDSVYKDSYINQFSVDERKTKVDHWGRFAIQ